MTEQNRITEEELIELNSLKSILNKYHISEEQYLINSNEHHQTSKVCLNKTNEGSWHTYIKIKDSIFNSFYATNLKTAVITFVRYLSTTEEQYLMVIQEFLNINNPQTKKTKYIKCRRKKH